MVRDKVWGRVPRIVCTVSTIQSVLVKRILSSLFGLFPHGWRAVMYLGALRVSMRLHI